MLHTVDRIRNVKSDPAEINGCPSKAKCIYDSTYNGHHQRRNLLREQIASKNAHERDKQDRKSYKRISKHIKYSLRRHPDKSNPGNRSEKCCSWEFSLHPRTDKSTKSFHSTSNETCCYRCRPCEFRIIERIVKRHDHSVQHNEHGRCRNTGWQSRYVCPSFFFRKPPSHKRIINAAQHQTYRHTRYNGSVYNLIRPFQDAGKSCDNNQIVYNVICNGIGHSTNVATLKPWHKCFLFIHFFLSLLFKYYASVEIKEKVVTSNSPISVSFTSGITARDMKHSVITGSTSPLIPSSE